MSNDVELEDALGSMGEESASQADGAMTVSAEKLSAGHTQNPSADSSASFEEAIESMLQGVVDDEVEIEAALLAKLSSGTSKSGNNNPRSSRPVPIPESSTEDDDDEEDVASTEEAALEQHLKIRNDAGYGETPSPEKAEKTANAFSKPLPPAAQTDSGDEAGDEKPPAPPPRRGSAATASKTGGDSSNKGAGATTASTTTTTTTTTAAATTTTAATSKITKVRKKFNRARKKSSAIAALQAKIGLEEEGNLLKRVYLPIILSGNFDTQDVHKRHDILQLLLDDIENIPIGDLKKILFALMGESMGGPSGAAAAGDGGDGSAQADDAAKFAETLRNIFAMQGSIDDIVTPGMIRSCNLVARGATVAMPGEELPPISEGGGRSASAELTRQAIAAGVTPVGLTDSEADAYARSLAKYRVIDRTQLMSMCRRRGLSTRGGQGSVLELASTLAQADAKAGTRAGLWGDLPPNSLNWTAAQLALYRRRKAQLDRQCADICHTRHLSYEKLDELSNYRRELASLKMMPRAGMGPSWGKITKEGVFDVQMPGQDVERCWVKLVDAKLLFYAIHDAAADIPQPPLEEDAPIFTVNLRQVDSVMTGMDSSATELTLVRTVANTTDAVKFVSMDPNVAEEWKVAINENRFNCKQILDLSEASQAFSLLLKESLNMVCIDDQPAQQMAVKLYDTQLRLFTHAFSGEEVLVRSVPLRDIQTVSYSRGLRIKVERKDPETGAETISTIALVDMGAMDALPWKIIIDEHRKPDGPGGVVDLGLGNDLVLKQDIFQIQSAGSIVQRMVQLYDSQIRMLPTRNRHADDGSSSSGSSYNSLPLHSNRDHIVIDLDAIHTVQTRDARSNALTIMMKDPRLFGGEVHFVDITLADAIEWKAAINYNRFKGTAFVEGQSSVRDVSKMLNNISANFDACHVLDRVVVYSERKSGHFTCVKDAADPQRNWIPGRFIHQDEIGYMKKIVLFASMEEARRAREEDNGVEAPEGSAGYGYCYDDADDTIDIRQGFLTEAARLEAERRYINAQAMKAHSILERELSLPRGQRIVQLEAEFAKVAEQKKKLQQRKIAGHVEDDGDNDDDDDEEEDSIDDAEASSLSSVEEMDTADRDIKGLDNKAARELMKAAVAASEPLTKEELAAAKRGLILRLNQCVIRVCIQKFRRKFPVIESSAH